VKDGQIIGWLKKQGIVTGAISGRESNAVSRRCAELKVDFCHQGIMDKASVVEKLAKHYKLKLKEIAYIGDDINDLGAMELVGLRVCPADAPDYVKERVHLVASVKGGRGVLREVSDLVLAAQGAFEKILKN
jgi:3-deoxy-D-manno-octulosonate 8-phosphate phosphatase (KDO 8-P phosphatase)